MTSCAAPHYDQLRAHAAPHYDLCSRRRTTICVRGAARTNRVEEPRDADLSAEPIGAHVQHLERVAPRDGVPRDRRPHDKEAERAHGLLGPRIADKEGACHTRATDASKTQCGAGGGYGDMIWRIRLSGGLSQGSHRKSPGTTSSKSRMPSVRGAPSLALGAIHPANGVRPALGYDSGAIPASDGAGLGVCDPGEMRCERPCMRVHGFMRVGV
eukprot:2164797-Prymnesium_polylepis.1